MDLTNVVKKFVEKKLGKVIDKDLKTEVTHEDTIFEIGPYANKLFDKYFPEDEIEKLKNEILQLESETNAKSYVSDDSTGTDEYSHESIELDANEFHNFSPDDIINNLQSESTEIRVKCLKDLIFYAEDLINQSYWNIIKKILQNFLEKKTGRETQILTLKIFQKFLLCSSKPQLVCEAFSSLAEILALRLEIINSIRKRESLDEVYDLKGDMWVKKDASPEIKFNEKDHGISEHDESLDSEVIIKSMILLVKCQNQMPGKWIRFNGKRLREIVFSFIHLLSTTTTSEFEKLTGFELLSVLSPRGEWCRRWCHTAAGRSLLCSALKKYKRFFDYVVVDTLLTNMKKRKPNYLLPLIDNVHARDFTPNRNYSARPTPPEPQNDHQKLEANKENQNVQFVRSAPTTTTTTTTNSRRSPREPKKPKSRNLIEEIPRKVADEAAFCHAFSFAVALLKSRSGRSLFPAQTAVAKRLLNVQDLVSSMTSYLNAFEREQGSFREITVTPTYRQHMLNLAEELESVQMAIYSPRKSASRSRQLSHR